MRARTKTTPGIHGSSPANRTLPPPAPRPPLLTSTQDYHVDDDALASIFPLPRSFVLSLLPQTSSAAVRPRNILWANQSPEILAVPTAYQSTLPVRDPRKSRGPTSLPPAGALLIDRSIGIRRGTNVNRISRVSALSASANLY